MRKFFGALLCGMLIAAMIPAAAFATGAETANPTVTVAGGEPVEIENNNFQDTLNGLDAAGKDVTVNIPEGTTLYCRYHNNAVVYIPKNFKSITFTGKGTLKVTELGNLPLYMNGVPAVINDITLADSIVAGSGDGTEVSSTNLTLNNVKQRGSVSVFGGSGSNNRGAVGKVQSSKVVVNGSSSIHQVYGGSNGKGIVENSYVEINGGDMTYIFGGGNGSTTTDNTNVVFNGGETDYITGGSHSAYTKNAKVTINSGATVNVNVFGAGIHTATADNTEVVMNGGTVKNSIYGAGMTATMTGDTHITIKGGTVVKAVYGGGYILPSVLPSIRLSKHIFP